MLAFRKRIMQETCVHPKSKNEKCDGVAERKRRIRETRDEGFYIPPAARLRTLFFRFAASKRTQPLPTRRALLLTSPCVFDHPACKPRLSCVAVPPKSKPSEAGSIRRGGAPQHCRRTGNRQKRLPILSRAQGAPTSRRRYNTLDLAGKIVCQGRPRPLWIPPPRNRPVSLDAFPQRNTRMRTVMLIPRFLCQRGRRPL